jgi:hypothetical protein
MSDPHATGAPEHAGASGTDHAAATDRVDAHGHDDHGHGSDTLGPVDAAAWGAGILGVAISVAIAIAFVMATSSPG